MKYRDLIVQAMTKKKLFPADYSLYPEDDVTETLADGGLYPDIEDPKFVARLLKKSEFADTISRRQTAAASNPCETGPGFEVTPVQRFVANFLHPRTPYMSMLLYHGVGVGKTCAAIQTAEAYLDVYPRRKVLIVVPRNIRSGFIRTIFDMENLTMGTGNTPNSAVGCTGDTYLKLAGCLFERDKGLIEKRIIRVMNQRYAFFGYGQFKNYIRNVVKKIPLGSNEKENEQRIATALKNEFNYRLLIIDEAHNLRDVAGSSLNFAGDEDDEEEAEVESTVEQPVQDAAEDEGAESKAGKELTPYLKQLLRSTDGMKLLLMTATPMFNSVFEIVFLLNLLLMNDKKAEVSMDKLLDANGNVAGEPARRLFRRIANAYISFMRGENPDSFPIRLFPEGELRDGKVIPRITTTNYPQFEMANEKGKQAPKEVNPDEVLGMSKLPLVKSSGMKGGQFDTLLRKLTDAKIAVGGTGYQVVDSLLQAGNCMFPLDEDPETTDPERFFGNIGFFETFEKVPNGKGAVTATDNASWLKQDKFSEYSPKGAMILESVRNSEGVCFVYSRFVMVGAFLLALAFEANGYTPYGRSTGFLANGIQSPGGRQCALCTKRENDHAGEEYAGEERTGEKHTFKPAKYVLLTGDKTLSPNVAEAIKVARSKENVNGELVKVVIGSQIAAEGLDLRFVREVHIFDAWFHLNKTEQIIGRGIRFCSHSLINPPSKRNTTIFLHITTFADDKTYRETADLYCYRKALEKAILTGKVSRELKIGAVDCNLRKNVTVITGLKNRIQIDSQGRTRRGNDPNNPGISVNDTDFTAMCDWMGCSYVCDPNVTVDPPTSDTSTYDIFSARFRETKIQQEIKKLFAEQPFFAREEFIQALMIRTQAPKPAILMTIQSIVNNRTFHLQVGSHQGYVIYKNGMFLFQPDVYKDTSIPLALRIAEWPVKRDEYEPMDIKPDLEPLIKPAKPAALAAAAANKSDDEVMVVDEPLQVSVKPRNEFWAALVKWTDDCVHNRIASVEGTEIERIIEKFTENSKNLRKLYMDKLEGILFINKRASDKTKLREAILEFFWDEWIHPMEQVRMLLDNLPGTAEVGKEQAMRDGTVRAIRHVNAETNVLTFTCEDGKPCSRLITDAFMSLPDPIKSRKADEDHTAILYGFMVPKNGNMVFKTNKPHEVGGSVGIRKGQECGIVTATSQYQDPLLTIGRELSRLGMPNLDLTIGVLREEIANFKSGCAVLDIALRYLDKQEAGNKRWFFRPVAAFYSGHRGLRSKAAKAADDAAAKLLKKQEAELKKQQQTAAKTAAKPAAKKPAAKVVAAPTPAAPPAAPKKPVTLLPPVAVRKNESSNNESSENESSNNESPPPPTIVAQPPIEAVIGNNGLSPIEMEDESLTNDEQAEQAAAEKAAANKAAAEKAAANKAAANKAAAEKAAANKAAAERAAALVPAPAPAPAPAAPPAAKKKLPVFTTAPTMKRKVVKNTEG